MYVRVCVHVCVCTYTCFLVVVKMSEHPLSTRKQNHTNTQTDTHRQTHTQTHAHTDRHTHTHTHTHTHKHLPAAAALAHSARALDKFAGTP